MKALLLIDDCMDKVNSMMISSIKSTNKVWKAQRGTVLNKAQRGAEEKRCDKESNIEMEGNRIKVKKLIIKQKK